MSSLKVRMNSANSCVSYLVDNVIFADILEYSFNISNKDTNNTAKPTIQRFQLKP